MASLSLSIVEIIVLMLGAITLGFAVHFIIFSKRSFRDSPLEKEKISKTLEEWKLRYFNDTEVRDKELATLRKQVEEAHENNEINIIEAEETRKTNKKLQAEIEGLKKGYPPGENGGPRYIEQLKQAQNNLLEHHLKINLLLGQIELARDSEEKQQQMLHVNEELSIEVEELKRLLFQKEKEISNSRQNHQITKEMTSMIDSAYNEFHVLQEKIMKLEGQVNESKKMSLEYEDIKENHLRITGDLEEVKKKYQTISSDHNQLLEELTETEDKLKEANFQRQQLQKRVTYLEELNNDMKVVAEANMKLESQLRRVAELESMLNVVAGERDHLAGKQLNG